MLIDILSIVVLAGLVLYTFSGRYTMKLYRHLTCADCVRDEQAIDAWREAGGELPTRTCALDHRSHCRKCDAVLGENRDEANSHIGLKGFAIVEKICFDCKGKK